MSGPVKAVLVGAGLVGQVCHLATLTSPNSEIVLAGVVDASLTRAQGIAQAHGVPAANTLQGLDLSEIDAVVIAAPDPAHRAAVEEALAAGLHVFCEKPLSLTSNECEELNSKARAAGKIAQVGYMKRFDPVYECLKNELINRNARITSVAVEVRDPDAAPFVRDYPFVAAGNDVDPEIISAGNAQFRSAVDSVLGVAANDEQVTAWGSFIGALIHDLNFVRGFVEAPSQASVGFVGMDGLQVGLHYVNNDGILVRMTHTQVPHTADYKELITFYTTTGVYEVVFPAPYLLNATTPLLHFTEKDANHEAQMLSLNDSTEEAFVRELESFARSIKAGARTPERNSFGDAADDLRILESAMKLAYSS